MAWRLFNARLADNRQPERSELLDDMGQWPIGQSYVDDGLANGWLVYVDSYIDIFDGVTVNQYRLV